MSLVGSMLYNNAFKRIPSRSLLSITVITLFSTACPHTRDRRATACPHTLNRMPSHSSRLHDLTLMTACPHTLNHIPSNSQPRVLRPRSHALRPRPHALTLSTACPRPPLDHNRMSSPSSRPQPHVLALLSTATCPHPLNGMPSTSSRSHALALLSIS